MAKNDVLSVALQEDILATLAHNDRHGRELAERIRVDLFEGDYRVFAERIVEYWRTYKKPPGPHTGNLFSDIMADPDSPRAKTYHNIVLQMLCVVEAEAFNPQMVLDGLNAFHRQQEMKQTTLQAAELLARGGSGAVMEAENLFRSALDKQGATSTGLISASEFTGRDEVEYWWRPFLPYDMLSILVGEKLVGKTTIILDVAARLSRQKLSTVYITKEAGGVGALKRQMRAAGGDVSRLLFAGAYDADGNPESTPPDRLTRAVLANLERDLRRKKEAGEPVGLIAIEPLNSFIDATKANSDAGVRDVLDPLAMMADRLGVMVVVSAHLNKNEEMRTRSRIMGSVAVVSTARSVNILIKDPDDSERRLLINLLGNFSVPGERNAFGYRMKSVRSGSKVEWDHKDDMFLLDEDEVDEITMRKTGSRPPGRPRKIEHASKLLRIWLKDGERPQKEIVELANHADISVRTLNTAKDICNVASVRRQGRSYWQLGEVAKIPPLKGGT